MTLNSIPLHPYPPAFPDERAWNEDSTEWAAVWGSVRSLWLGARWVEFKHSCNLE